ncbi:hypothetical protein ACOSQ4_004796 [Xanthoceras sorbifolium]
MLGVIRSAFLPVDAEEILKLPLGVPSSPDVLVWHLDKSRSLASGESWWKFLWRIQIPEKVKLFLWRACFNWIPTLKNLASQKVSLLAARCVSDVLKPQCTLFGNVFFKRKFIKLAGFFELDVSTVVYWAQSFLEDFREANLTSSISQPSRSFMENWQAQGRGLFKVNCHAAVNIKSNSTGLGVVIRNFQGLSWLLVLGKCMWLLTKNLLKLLRSAVESI